MLVGITGAKIEKGESSYRVVYKEHLIFESKTKGVALTVALSKKQCENLLTSVTNQV
jgi:hypothetical protein